METTEIMCAKGKKGNLCFVFDFFGEAHAQNAKWKAKQSKAGTILLFVIKSCGEQRPPRPRPGGEATRPRLWALRAHCFYGQGT